jgi:hypothetical protein
MCILHTISHGTTQQSIHLYLVQEVWAERVHFQTHESWLALCVWCNCGPCSDLLPMHLLCGSQSIYRVWVRFAQNFENFSINWYGCEFLSVLYLRFQVLTAASMMFRIVFWDVLPCKMIVERHFRGAYCLHHQGWVSLARKDRGYIGV